MEVIVVADVEMERSLLKVRRRNNGEVEQGEFLFSFEIQRC